MISLSLCGIWPLLKQASQATNIASHRSMLWPIIAWKPGSGARCSRHLSIYGLSLVARSVSMSSMVILGIIGSDYLRIISLQSPDGSAKRRFGSLSAGTSAQNDTIDPEPTKTGSTDVLVSNTNLVTAVVQAEVR